MKFWVLAFLVGIFSCDPCEARLSTELETTLRDTAKVVFTNEADVDHFVRRTDDLLFRHNVVRPTSAYFMATFRAAQKIVPARTLEQCLHLARSALVEWNGDVLLFEYAFLKAQDFSRDQWSFDYAIGVASTFGDLQYYADHLAYAQESLRLSLHDALLYAERMALAQGAPDRSMRSRCSGAL